MAAIRLEWDHDCNDGIQLILDGWFSLHRSTLSFSCLIFRLGHDGILKSDLLGFTMSRLHCMKLQVFIITAPCGVCGCRRPSFIIVFPGSVFVLLLTSNLFGVWQEIMRFLTDQGFHTLAIGPAWAHFGNYAISFKKRGYHISWVGISCGHHEIVNSDFNRVAL